MLLERLSYIQSSTGVWFNEEKARTMHAKYIKKDGKRFGPYYYLNVRDKNGRTRTTYLGSNIKKAFEKQEKLKEKGLTRIHGPKISLRMPKMPAASGKILLPILAMLLAIGLSNITGLVTSPQGQEYEHLVQLQASSSEDFINYTIIFDQYRPKTCEDGIYVSDGTNSISFEVINEAYDGGLCKEATIRFENRLYEGGNIITGMAATEEMPEEETTTTLAEETASTTTTSSTTTTKITEEATTTTTVPATEEMPIEETTTSTLTEETTTTSIALLEETTTTTIAEETATTTTMTEETIATIETTTTTTLETTSTTAIQEKTYYIYYGKIVKNNPPQLTENIPNIRMSVNSNYTINLQDYFSDADNDPLAFSATQADNITITIENGIATVNPQKDFTGLRAVEFSASDSLDTVQSNTVVLDIYGAQNTPPKLVSDIPDAVIHEGGDAAIDLSKYFTDDDGDALEYFASQTAGLDVTIENSIATISPHSGFSGKEQAVFYATDGDYTAASNEVLITVEAAIKHAITVKMQDNKKTASAGVVSLVKNNLNAQDGIGNKLKSAVAKKAAIKGVDKNDFDNLDTGNYDVIMESEKALVTISGLDVEDNVTLLTQADFIVPSDPLEGSITTPVFAMNDSGIAFDYADITLPKAGDVNIILKCAAWDFDTFSCDSWQKTQLGFSQNNTHISFRAGSFSAYAGANITILNPYTYLRDNETWTVAFNTTGTADLIINSTNANWEEVLIDNPSTEDEMRFLNITCGNAPAANLQIIDENGNYYDYSSLTEQDSVRIKKLFIANYSCDETSYLSNYMNKAGYAILQFTFGDATAFAYDPDNPPTYSLDSTNSTAAGTAIKHSLFWQDDVNLSGYIFSFDNGSGIFVNDSWVPMRGVINVQVSASANDAYVSDYYGFDPSSGYAYIGYEAADPAVFHTFARFTGITIPAGSKIDVAYLQVYGYTSTSPAVPWGSPTMKIAANDSDSSSAPTSLSEFNALVLTTAQIDWDTTFSVAQWYTSPSIVSIIQELLASYTISGDALLFTIKNDGGTTEQGNGIGQYDASYGMVLYIGYSNNWTNVTKVVNSTVGATIRWCVYVNDSAGNMNSTSCANPFSYVTTGLDTTPPTITIQLPANTTYNYNLSIPLNYTASDAVGLSHCKYSLDDATNVTFTNCNTNATFNVSQGWHKLRVYVNDTSGNNASANVNFSVDSLIPNLTIVSPTACQCSNNQEATSTSTSRQTRF